MGRGSTIVYGKITLASEGESVDQLMKHLSKLIKEHGYPDAGAAHVVSMEQIEKELEEERAAEEEESEADEVQEEKRQSEELKLEAMFRGRKGKRQDETE